MARFGGNEFTHFSVPLVFEDHYFILEPTTTIPLITVVRDYEGQPVFEVLKNQPIENPLTDVTKTPPGIVTVADRQTDQFLYKVRPGSETSVVFGTVTGEDISVSITDRHIRVGDQKIENNTFSGPMAGVVIGADGSVGIAAPIPEQLRQWFGRA